MKTMVLTIYMCEDSHKTIGVGDGVLFNFLNISMIERRHPFQTVRKTRGKT